MGGREDEMEGATINRGSTARISSINNSPCAIAAVME